MYTEIVMTGGISLFSGGNVFGKLTRDKGFFRFERTNPLPKDLNNEEEEIVEWIQDMRNNFGEIMGQDGNISAEYSMINALKLNKKLAERPKITLIHTDTFAGRAAAYLNKEILNRSFKATVILDSIKDLDVSDRVKLNRSLGNFMLLINKHLQGKYKDYVCFAPIGGYKIFTSLGHIVASLNGLPLAYLHEDKQILHEIPPIPVKYEDDFIVENREFLRKIYIQGILRQKELSYHQSKFIKENSYIFEIVDDMVAINPFGLFLFEQEKFRQIFGTRVFISQAAIQVMKNNPSSKEFIQQQILELVKKVEGEVNIANLYHEREYEILQNKALKYHLYKGASNGIHVFRVTWEHDKEKKEMHINYIWLDHNISDREVPRGKGLEESFGGFEEFTEEIYQI